ncbi:MAG: T9SS type A sorting domain-containing protein [Bacteroidetes bacterium]|nr:T9SS type A sorting domain-containing protein [Bacteroidota bacterium]
MRILFYIFLVIIFSQVCNAQITFQKTYGGTKDDIGNVTVQTNDGGFIIAGITESFGEGNFDIYLVKATSDGVMQWSKTFGSTNNDRAYSVQQTNDSGYIIAGYTNGFGLGNDDVYLLKISSNGTLQWSKTFGGQGNDIASFVQQTNDGGYILTGFTNSFGAKVPNIYLIKTYSDGTMQWSKTYGGTVSSSEGNSVQQTNDGGFIITGYTSSFGAGSVDVYLVKTASDGTLQWTKTFGGTGDDYGYSGRQTIDGGYIITGETYITGGGISDMYLIKTDSNGSLQWTKIFGGSSNDEGGYAVEETNDGGFIIAGETRSFGSGYLDVYLVKTTSSGILQWSKTFGGTGSDRGNFVQQTNDGFIITGYTGSFGKGAGDIYLIKTDSNGNSGCNETNPNTILSSGGIQGSGGIQNTGGTTTTPATQVSTGGIETTLCLTVGTNENNHANNSVYVSPNPSTGIFQIQMDNVKWLMANGNTSINIYNLLGEKIFTSTINHQTSTIDISNEPKGIYFYKIAAKDRNEVATGKLIIQ